MPMLTTLRIGLPVCPFHSPLRTRLAKAGHLVEHGMHLRNDVDAVDLDRLALRGTQGDVQHGPILGDVDLVAAEHGVDADPQIRLARQAAAAAFSVSSVMRFLE